MQIGDIIKFGNYPQGKDRTQAPIEWIVLDVNCDEVFIISRYGLARKKYNNNHAPITWENCDLREWLNNDFIKKAFSDEEANKIKVSKLENKDNPLPINFESMFPRARGGNDTLDRVFCLSIDEAEQYLSNLNQKMKCDCTWWLRSPGYYQGSAMYVDYNGTPDLGGCDPCMNDHIAVRPALRMILSKKNMEQKLVNIVKKNHNLQCGIFGNISDDLGELQIPELSPMVQMAYAYARRFAAGGLYVQGVFSYDQYMYICTVFMSYQITTTKDANLLPGEDVSFQEEALKQAAELLITYDHRFNISFIKFFSTALHNQGKSFPVLPRNSSYEKAVELIEKQIASFLITPTSKDNQKMQWSSDDHKNQDNSCINSMQQKHKGSDNSTIYFIIAIVIMVIILIVTGSQYHKARIENQELLYKLEDSERVYNYAQHEISTLRDYIVKRDIDNNKLNNYISELKKDNEKQKSQISELIKQQEKSQKKTNDTSYWTVYYGSGGFIDYTLNKKTNDYALYLSCEGFENKKAKDVDYDMRVNIDLPNGKTIDNSKDTLTFIIDGKMYYAQPQTSGLGSAKIWDNFVIHLFKGKHIEVIKDGKTITTFEPTKESISLVKDADCTQYGWNIDMEELNLN